MCIRARNPTGSWKSILPSPRPRAATCLSSWRPRSGRTWSRADDASPASGRGLRGDGGADVRGWAADVPRARGGDDGPAHRPAVGGAVRAAGAAPGGFTGVRQLQPPVRAAGAVLPAVRGGHRRRVHTRMVAGVGVVLREIGRAHV